MTEKELRKLKRSDFLQMLITQGKDMSAVQTDLAEKSEALEQLQSANESLQTKLDEKDEMIAKLLETLNGKETMIGELRQEIEDVKSNRQIELKQAGSIAMAALNLNGVFETAQKAADQYLYNIQLMHDELEAKCRTGQAPQAQEPLEEALQTEKPEALPEQAPQEAFESEPVEEAPAPIPTPEEPMTEEPAPEEPAPPPLKLGLLEKLRILGTL